jgi:hypothetical protein
MESIVVIQIERAAISTGLPPSTGKFRRHLPVFSREDRLASIPAVSGRDTGWG